MAKLRCLPALILLLPGLSSSAEAQNLQCGVDCNSRTYRSCNDQLNLATASLPVSCSASLGSCEGEVFCASLGHAIPAAAFPVDIDEILLVASDGSPTAPGQPFDLQIFEELGAAMPGPQLGPTYNLSIPGSTTRATRVDLAAPGFAPIRVGKAGPFRVCLTKRFDSGHNVCLDPGQSTAGRNWAFVDIALDPSNPCGTTIGSPAWYEAGNPLFPNIQGDFIIRARVRPANFIVLPGADDCGGSSDAGVSDGPSDDDDTGTPDAAPSDAGPVDAQPAEDVGNGTPTDAGLVSAPPPSISEVSPSNVQSDMAFELIVAGADFQTGAVVRVGTRTLGSAALFGTSTLTGRVDPGLPSGRHDVVVVNPDGQVAIAAGVVEAAPAGADAPAPESDCRCTQPGRDAPGWWVGLLGLGGFFVRFGSRRSRSKYSEF